MDEELTAAVFATAPAETDNEYSCFLMKADKSEMEISSMSA